MKELRSEKAVLQVIERLSHSKGSRTRLALSLGDDAALWGSSPGFETILTCDWFLEGKHFLKEKHPADAVGWKCLARAVSDIAAMGGKPSCFLLSLALPQELTGKWLNDFLQGLRRASRSLHLELAGGDTTRNERIQISVAVVGEVRSGKAVLRSGARPGDLIYASGTLGEAQLGLQQLRRQHRLPRKASAALQKHLYPTPRLQLGEWLSENRLATAMMDLSDGLSSDLPRLCASSGVGARIETNLLPVTSLTSAKEALEYALHGGDDYELLFTVPQKKARLVHDHFRGVKLTHIGEITRNKSILRDENGSVRALRPGGWDPFGLK